MRVCLESPFVEPLRATNVSARVYLELERWSTADGVHRERHDHQNQ